MFTNFRIKIKPNVDSFWSYFEENIPTKDFLWKNNQIYIIFTYKQSILFKNPKFSGNYWKLPMNITLEPNMLDTWNLFQNVKFWILYCIPLLVEIKLLVH